ncbi:MAG: heme-binding protein [Pseudomonadota bacterium]
MPRKCDVITVLILLSAAWTANAVEEPAFELVRQTGDFEIRRYPPLLLAETLVEGEFRESGNEAFWRLAGFIGGENATSDAEAVKIDMTAPVISRKAAGQRYWHQFVMPQSYNLQTLPKPLNSEVVIKEFAGGTFAVRRFSGRWRESYFRRETEELTAALKAAGIATTGAPLFARYNSPFMPAFMRRNEVWLAVEQNIAPQ